MAEASFAAEVNARMEEHKRAIELELLYPWPSRGRAWWRLHFWRWIVSRGYRELLIAKCASRRVEALSHPPQHMTGLLSRLRD